MGALDACGVCNGPGAVEECGCSGIPAGDCDCDGNQHALGVCGGSCTADADADGICDDVDDCVGTPDVDGVCNGDCTADADADGICDDVDDCVGQLDECGICNGPGATGDCGCDDIPVGDCDCNGNQLDALGVCGGLRRMRMRTGFVMTSTTAWALDAIGVCNGTARRTSSDGICDDVDDCIGRLDECGVCNGPGAITTAGAPPCQTRIVTATETSSTPLAIAVGPARRMPMGMASAMMWTTAWVTWTPVACAMAPAPSTNAGATTFPMGIATATETSWTPVESVEAPVTLSAAVRRSR